MVRLVPCGTRRTSGAATTAQKWRVDVTVTSDPCPLRTRVRPLVLTTLIDFADPSGAESVTVSCNGGDPNIVNGRMPLNGTAGRSRTADPVTVDATPAA